MDTLHRINKIFENVRSELKGKKQSENVPHLKKDVQMLSNEISLLGRENHASLVRSIAMEGYLALLNVKTIPMSLLDKKKMLQTVFDKLKPHAIREECLFIFLRVQNLLCYYLINLDDSITALSILEDMEDLYLQVNNNQPTKYVDTEDLFSAEPMSKVKQVNPQKIDKVITNNIQMQAFLYNKFSQNSKYALYNHTALRRQLEMRDGNPQEWALRAARLGNFFVYLNEMKNAREHLCAAYHVLRTCHDNCKLKPEEFVLQKAAFELHFLELSHHWTKYGLTLFKLSKKKVLGKYTQPTSSSIGDLWHTLEVFNDNGEELRLEDENVKDASSEKNDKGDCCEEKLYIFPSLNLKEIEKRVPIDLVLNVDAARRLFAFTHKWLSRAKRYYDFEHYPTQYISCSLQLAELYEHLAFFEKNVDNQYSLQKRRADVLEALNSLLKSCDNVMSVQIDVIKELSQVQLEMMALNLQKLWHEESQTNMFSSETDTDYILNSLSTEATNKTLTSRELSSKSKNMLLKKMEAATALSGKLGRLSGTLSSKTPSILSFGSLSLK